MKKKSLKNFKLNKKTISHFKFSELTGGKETTVSSVLCYLATCTDLPTIQDNCFTLDDNKKCNDFR